jgi:hypothetical protein
MRIYVIHYFEGDSTEDHLTAQMFATTMHDAVIMFKQNYTNTTILHVEQKYE